jgi:hypothetical protein
LATGEYLVDFQLSGSDSYHPIIYSSEGTQLVTLPKVKDIGHFSPDFKYLSQLPEVIDLTTHEWFQIEGIDGCATSTWSPDSKYLIADCWDPKTGAGFYLISIEKRLGTYIPGCDVNYGCDFPTWSPDGKWIVYDYGRMASGTSIVDGLHFMDVKCFSAPDTCIRDGIPGIPDDPPFSWSPDSQFIAGKRADGVSVLKMAGQTATYYRTYYFGSLNIMNISWSPSGKWIAVQTDNGVSLVDVSSGKQTPLEMQEFNSWISIP